MYASCACPALPLILFSHSSSCLDACIVKLRLWRNISSLWTMMCIMSSISSPPSPEILSWHRSRRERHGFCPTECWRVSVFSFQSVWPQLPIHPTDAPFQSWIKRMKSDLLSTKVISITSPVMFDFGCPNVNDARKVFDQATRTLAPWVVSGARIALCAM
jgi:hypothetical protein